MRSLKIFLKDKINEIMKLALQFATNTFEEMDIPLMKIRILRKKKVRSGEKTQDVPVKLNEVMKRSMLEFIDMF
ncbi:hypothetical protein PR048_021728 [Dryococelus australis]|uniref:Uncharacterized protein n=1 Tax=Dryococelus australis TaxID=614101 RepID=A0ABQ9GZ39_9NEOP|nr:hypothetical protein PR048_021728 [Dryococelus australis]